jgi:hypothetical protein
MGVNNKKHLKLAFKNGDVGTYSKKTTANRCRKGFTARKGSTTCRGAKGSYQKLTLKGLPDRRYKINK